MPSQGRPDNLCMNKKSTKELKDKALIVVARNHRLRIKKEAKNINTQRPGNQPRIPPPIKNEEQD